jgi:flagellin-like protein
LRGGVEKKMKFTKLLRNKKAISPIFATLILIAIAVIAGIVVYMFTSGTIASMTGGGTAGQEKVAVQGVDIMTNTIYAQNTGGVVVTITNATVKDAAGNVVAQTAAPATLNVDAGLTGISVGTTLSDLSSGTYTVTIVSSKGGSFVSSSFVVA